MTALTHLRFLAFHAQKHRCCYCSLTMWLASPAEIQAIGLQSRSAALLRCTAEHLVAKQDGGKNVAGNIAAACWYCNTHRHKRKTAPAPDAYRTFVERRKAKGKWNSFLIAPLRNT